MHSGLSYGQDCHLIFFPLVSRGSLLKTNRMEKLVAMDHDITVSEKLVDKQNEIDIDDKKYIGGSGSKDIRSFKKLWLMLAVIMAIDLLVLFGTLILYNFVDTTGSRKDSQEFISTNLSQFVTKIIWISYGLSTLLKTIIFLLYHPWSSMRCKNMFSNSCKGCNFGLYSDNSGLNSDNSGLNPDKSGLNADVQKISQEDESMLQNKDEVNVIIGAPDYHKYCWGKAYDVGINCLPQLFSQHLWGPISTSPCLLFLSD